MSPPRKPRGEKPTTTIRLLRRQLSIAQATVAALQLDRSDKEKVIAGYDVQLSESDETERTLRNRVADQAMHIGELNARLRQKSERLAYLEGYHAKSQEIRPVSAAGASISRDQPQTDAGERARDQENLPRRRQRGESAGIDQGPAGFGPRLGDPLWRQHPHDISDPNELKVEHIEIKDGIS